MSNKITYVLEVLDKYSKNTVKFKKEISSLEKCLNDFDRKLNSTFDKFSKFEKIKFSTTASEFEKMAKSMNKVSVATEKARRASSKFVLLGGGSQSIAISASEIRRQRQLQNALVPYSNPFVRMGGGSSSGIYNTRKYRPNFTIPIDTTYSKTSLERGLTIYRGGGALVPYGNQRPMIDVTNTASSNSFSVLQPPSQPPRPQRPPRPQKPSGFLAGDGVSFTGVAKAIGYYSVIDKAIQAPKLIYENTKSMDSLRASLSALIPNVKGLEGVSAESEIGYIRSIANRYGVGFSDIAPSYMKILGSGGADASLAKGILENVSGYGRLVGLSAPAMQDTLRGIQDMLNKQKINAQEFNLQMQQLVGAKPMFFEAFRRVATRSGAKGITKENAGALFYKYMEEGKMPSAPILREFLKVIEEMFGEKMLEKAKTLGAEEERLKNSFQELGTTIGDLTYSTQIGAIRGLTSLTMSVNQFANNAGMVSSYIRNLLGDIAPEGGVVRKTASVLGGTALDIGKMAYGSHFYAAKYGGAYAFAQVANLMGDSSLKENYSEWAKEEFLKNNFEDLQAVYKTDFMTIINALKEGQKVEIKIDAPNVSVRDVKSNRPSTVIAGGR